MPANHAADPAPQVVIPSDTAPRVGPSLWPRDPATAQLDTMLARSRSAAPQCGSAASPPRITADSIGPFRLGASLSQLRQRCPRLLYGWHYVSDGYPEPAIAVRLGGALVRAFLTNPQPTAVMHRVELGGGGTSAKTAEGKGVGSTLQELQRAYGEPSASESDCVLVVWFDSRPGLQFRMEYPPTERRECGALSEAPLSPRLRVAGVILVER